jgi:AraC family transcriptional regulator of adaptative response/methylated-DNA-[protein]-cysteine methyltransferase
MGLLMYAAQKNKHFFRAFYRRFRILFRKKSAHIWYLKSGSTMESHQTTNYHRIEQAIQYISTHFQKQPSLDEVAAHLHLSPAHFQRMFTEWAGTSPKKFLQYISLAHAKNILNHNRQATLFDTSFEIGLSSTSRLHDLFVSIEGMTPAEYKNGGKNLNINYQFAATHFGQVLIASTSKGICHMAFEENKIKALEELHLRFPQAHFQQHTDAFQNNALSIFQNKVPDLSEIRLHLKGTDFQLKVWESLVKIPFGTLSTYSNIAKEIAHPNASRAVGTAIGSNPVALLIPCHRVIQSTGAFGGYMWGPVRKAALIGWEQAACLELLKP